MNPIIIDVVMPTVIKDMDTLLLAINGCINNVIGLRNIYIVSKKETCTELSKKMSTEFSNNTVEFIDENIFPFTLDDVAKLHTKNNRNGWYYQQLLKLYAYKVIDGISDNILIVDSDTVFLKNINFIEDNVALYATGKEYNIPYFTHMNKLHPSFCKLYPENLQLSGVCHHMLFQKYVLDELFELVEKYHGCSFWEAFLKCVDERSYLESGASEYEIYFNYVLSRHSDRARIRELNWCDICVLPRAEHFCYDYVSSHAYLRRPTTSSSNAMSFNLQHSIFRKHVHPTNKPPKNM